MLFSVVIIFEFDLFSNKAWFQFDDETVTEIKKLGDKRSKPKIIIDIEDDDYDQK